MTETLGRSARLNTALITETLNPVSQMIVFCSCLQLYGYGRLFVVDVLICFFACSFNSQGVLGSVCGCQQYLNTQRVPETYNSPLPGLDIEVVARMVLPSVLSDKTINGCMIEKTYQLSTRAPSALYSSP